MKNSGGVCTENNSTVRDVLRLKVGKQEVKKERKGLKKDRGGVKKTKEKKQGR